MDDRKKQLKGSPTRDAFKFMHKQKLSRRFYAADADLCLISKAPPGIIAYLDYKTSRDHITFAETILYNEWIESKPVFIIQSDNPNDGPFAIFRYLGGDSKPEPPEVDLELVDYFSDWQALGQWEDALRAQYRKEHTSG